MLLYAANQTQAVTEKPPEWVTEWLASRTERAEKKAEKPIQEPTQDLAAQAKRAQAREAKVAAGLAECRLWLDDLARQGIASLRTAPHEGVNRIATRMIDAQAPGVAAQLNRLATALALGEGWHTAAMAEVARLHLLVQAGLQLVNLPAEVQEDLRSALGWPQAKESALTQPAVSDSWLVLGVGFEADDRVRVRRTWFYGVTSKRLALILDFAVGPQTFPAGFPIGTTIQAEICYFPSRCPLRAVIHTRGDMSVPVTQPTAFASPDFDSAFATYASALSLNPWILRWPLVISNVRLLDVPQFRGDQESGKHFHTLTDLASGSLVVALSSLNAARLHAASPATAFTCVGEWDGATFTPTSAFTNDVGWLDLSVRRSGDSDASSEAA